MAVRSFVFVFLLVVFVAAPSPGQGQAPSIIPTSAFFERNNISQMKISPDGLHIAFSVEEDQGTRLMVLNLQQQQGVASFYTRSNQAIDDFYWVNNERIVFTMLEFQGGRDYPFLTGEIFALNIDNTRKFQLAGYGTGDPAVFYFSHLLPNDPEHIRVNRAQVRRSSISRSRPSSFLLNVNRRPSAPGRRRQANLSGEVSSPLPWGALYPDNSGEIRLAAAENEEGHVDVLYRDRSSTAWHDITDQIVNGAEQENDLDSLLFLGFSQDNNSAYYLTYGEQGTRAVYRYDSEAASSELVFGHPDFDIRPNDIVRSNDRNEIIGVKLFGDAIEQHYFSDHPDVSLHNMLDASFPGELVQVTSTTKDGSKAIVKVTGPQRLGNYYLLDAEAVVLDPLAQISDVLAPEKMADVRPFAIRATDRLVLHGYVTTPVGAKGPFPTIVLPHGGPFGIRDYPLFDREAQFFAHHGFAVLQINFRGSGGYGSAFVKAGYQQWGQAIIDDISQATKWAVQSGIAEADNICIFGSSFGGYAALMSVVKEPDLYQCTAGFAGVYDLTQMGRSDIPFQPGGDNYIETSIGADEERLRIQSPVFHADNIKVPVYIVHGTEDRRVPVFHARSMINALEDSGVEHSSWIERGASHGFYGNDNRIRLYDELLAFFNRHLSHGE